MGIHDTIGVLGSWWAVQWLTGNALYCWFRFQTPVSRKSGRDVSMPDQTQRRSGICSVVSVPRASCCRNCVASLLGPAYVTKIDRLPPS
jgi:hypothetical protein